MKYLRGPVWSRRLGLSLGVDLLQGQCTFLCPYCEVKVYKVDRPARFAFRDTKTLIREYKDFLSRGGTVDYVTFTGTGEPTLISNLGTLIAAFKRAAPRRVAVITNGSLL